MWVVYLIQNSITKEIYIGFTNNLKRRLNEHNMGMQKSTQRKNGEWKLIYAEAYRLKDDAITREKRLKQHGNAIHELKKRLKKSFLEN